MSVSTSLPVRSPTAEALGLPGCRTVVDDLAARKFAASLGIPATGTLGIVLRARSQGIIPATRPVVEDLLRGGPMGGPYRQPFYLRGLQPPYRHHLVGGQRFDSRFGNGHRRDRITQRVEHFEYTAAFTSRRMLYMIDEIRDVTGTQPVPLHVMPQGDAMKDLCLHGHSLSQGLERDEPKTAIEVPLEPDCHDLQCGRGAHCVQPGARRCAVCRCAGPLAPYFLSPAAAMEGTAGVNTERAKGLEPSTSSLGS